MESTKIYSQDGSACHRKRSNPSNLVHDKVAGREGIQAATVLWKLPKDKQRQRRTTVVLCNLSFPKGVGMIEGSRSCLPASFITFTDFSHEGGR